MTTVHKRDPLIRRPEVARLAEQLQRQNPAWSLERCLTQAKLAITTKTAKA
jgi:hypothetical protein